jgi:hypothetical protein
MRTLICWLIVAASALGVTFDTAEARTCLELRSLCWTMRDDKSDCARPYQRCLKTGVFITPLGRVFKATK